MIYCLKIKMEIRLRKTEVVFAKIKKDMYFTHTCKALSRERQGLSKHCGKL